MINWQPFSTAPKDRVIYAYHNVIGIRKIKWEEWPSIYQKTSNWLTLPNDAWCPPHAYTKQYCSEWTHWCEVSEIVPPRNLVIPKVTESLNNYTSDFAEF